MLPAIEVAEGERKIDAVLRRLAEGIEGIQDSTQFRLFLTTMAKFHTYSYSNQFLIMFQKPNATHVAGFVTWKDLGRWVKAGEQGIAILAPIFPPRATCPKCGAKISKGVQFCPKCGEPVGVEEEVEVRYFKVVSVFDISQTEGKALPEFAVPVLTGEANEELFAKVLALAKAQGLDVSFESRPQQDPSIKGQYFGKSTWVRPEESRAQQLKSLLHEVAHYYSEGVFRIPRRDAETIAESAAFAVGAHYGFDSGVRSFPYVALWAQDKKVLQENLGSIRRVASVMLDSLEKAQGAGEKLLPALKPWVYAKVGMTEVRGRRVATGIDIEQVSPSFNQDDFDKAVRVIEERLAREKLLPALKPFDPYKFCDYVLRNNVFSDKDTFVYSGLSGTNPHRVPDHYWAEALADMQGEFVKTGDLYVVHTPGVERPPTMRAAPTWREPSGELLIDVTKPKAVVRYKRNYGGGKSIFFVEYEYEGERYITGTVIRETKEGPAKSLGWYFGKGTEGLKEANRIALLSDEEFSKAEDLKEYSWEKTLKSLSEAKPEVALLPYDEELATMNLLAEVEGDPIRKFCCRQCGECAPAELLQEGRLPDRMAWLRHHYKAKHPGTWGKTPPRLFPETSEEKWLKLLTPEQEQLLSETNEKIRRRTTYGVRTEKIERLPVQHLVWSNGSADWFRTDVISKEYIDAFVKFSESPEYKSLPGWAIPMAPGYPEGVRYKVGERVELDANEILVYGKIKDLEAIMSELEPLPLFKHSTEARMRGFGTPPPPESKHWTWPPIWQKEGETKQPAVIPPQPSGTPNPKEELEFVADSPEFLAFTIEDIGYRERLDTAFETAIARAKGG